MALEPSTYVGVFGNRSGPRSRTGCRTCRERKVKCDETRPTCRRCARLSRPCVWPWRLDTLEPKMQEIRSNNGTILQRGQGCNNSTWSLVSKADAGSAKSHKYPNWVPCTLFPASYLSQSGVCLTQRDHEAVALYRTIFVSLHDTKNPMYSVPSIIFELGATSSLIMHSVLAIGKQYMAILANPSKMKGFSDPNIEAMHHYCNAIQLLGLTIATGLPPSELSKVLATIWLMLTYEESFGDDTSNSSLCGHFQGATSVIRANLSCLLAMLKSDTNHPESTDLSGDKARGLSYLTGRLLVRLTVLDARASSFGLGGQLNESLAELMGLNDPVRTEASWFHFLSGIYEQSAPVFQATWGAQYPKSELLYDVENEAAFQLYRHCSTLRLISAQIKRGGVDTTSLISASKQMIETLREQYVETFSIASGLPVQPNGFNESYLMTLCWVMPQYYACVLDLSSTPGMHFPEEAIVETKSEIMKLANYAWKKDGTSASARVAWPLFMVALHTTDSIHQDWIVDRFEQLSSYGRAYRKATQWLKSKFQSDIETEWENEIGSFFL